MAVIEEMNVNLRIKNKSIEDARALIEELKHLGKGVTGHYEITETIARDGRGQSESVIEEGDL